MAFPSIYLKLFKLFSIMFYFLFSIYCQIFQTYFNGNFYTLILLFIAYMWKYTQFYILTEYIATLLIHSLTQIVSAQILFRLSLDIYHASLNIDSFIHSFASVIFFPFIALPMVNYSIKLLKNNGIDSNFVLNLIKTSK